MEGSENETRTGAGAKKRNLINPLCRGCIHDCKQDINIKIIRCPLRLTKEQAENLKDMTTYLKKTLKEKQS